MRYPHFSLGQQTDFIGMNVQYHQLTYEQFIAGELYTIVTTKNQAEREGRIDLLQKISLWRLRSGVSWPQLRNLYAHVIKKVENREIMWSSDWERFERNIYDKVALPMTTIKPDKPKTNNPRQSSDNTWFCKAYQRVEGCTREAPHPGRVDNQIRSLQHICAACWFKNREKLPHSETSMQCPSRDQ